MPPEDDAKPAAPVVASAAAGDGPARDVVLVGPPSDDGEGFKVLRRRASTLEIGEIRAMKEGRPIHGDVVRLSRRPEHDRLFDVDVVVPAQGPGRSHAGPAQVATAAYRENWDTIFSPAPEDTGRGASN